MLLPYIVILQCLLTAAVAIFCRISLVNAKQCPNNECPLPTINNALNQQQQNQQQQPLQLAAVEQQQQQQQEQNTLDRQQKQHENDIPAKRVKRQEHNVQEQQQQQQQQQLHEQLRAQLKLQLQQRRQQQLQQQQQQQEQQHYNDVALDILHEETEPLLLSADSESESDSDQERESAAETKVFDGNEYEEYPILQSLDPFDFANLQQQHHYRQHQRIANNNNNINNNNNNYYDEKYNSYYNNDFTSNGQRQSRHAAATAAAAAPTTAGRGISSSSSSSSTKFYAENQQQLQQQKQQQQQIHKRQQEYQDVNDDFLLQLSELNAPERRLSHNAPLANDENNNKQNNKRTFNTNNNNNAMDNNNIVNGQAEFETIALERRRLPFLHGLNNDNAVDAPDLANNSLANNDDNSTTGDDELEPELPYGIQNVRKRKSAEHEHHNRGTTYQSLCPTKRVSIPLETAGYEYRPNHYIEVTCIHNYGNNHHIDFSRNKICSEAGFSCIQLNRTIHLIRRQKASAMDCWESEIRIVPSGCECMWPKHNYGDIIAYHDTQKRYMPQANEEAIADYKAGFGYLQIPRQAAHTRLTDQEAAQDEDIGYETYSFN